MKPLPTLKSSLSGPGDRLTPVHPTHSGSPPVNQHPAPCTIHRAYPWLLVLSTGIAGVFCLLYLTKPFIQPTQAAPPILANIATATTTTTPLPAPSGPLIPKGNSSLVPNPDRLPGDPKPTPPPQASNREIPPPLRTPAAFEQTNLRIQHIVTAEAPGGFQAKIDLDVPVLYQSRNLRWTASEVEAARKLLTQLSDYQEKSRNLRLEGIELLASWNSLVDRSIPASDLRADSPTLPTNQKDTAAIPSPATQNIRNPIQIKSETK